MKIGPEPIGPKKTAGSLSGVNRKGSVPPFFRFLWHIPAGGLAHPGGMWYSVKKYNLLNL